MQEIFHIYFQYNLHHNFQHAIFVSMKPVFNNRTVKVKDRYSKIIKTLKELEEAGSDKMASIDEAAIIHDCSTATVYRAIRKETQP